MGFYDDLDIYIMSDQPETCRKCGAGTDFSSHSIPTEEGYEAWQVHTCLGCGYKYKLVEDI